ncbi:MAG TPA: biotin/lipoyl-containing protein [Bryobacteraceae bacterium]|nr:biotin/lipoyl-containing protein [Bryobacteraceae bacterium]
MKLKITIDSKIYEVEVEASEPEAVHPPAYYFQPSRARVPAAAPVAPRTSGPAESGPVNEEKVCRSPISGIVVKISAQPGQQIQTGDTLLVLEAMKMETNITAPLSGVIARINVGQGDGVQGGQVLVEFE